MEQNLQIREYTKQQMFEILKSLSLYVSKYGLTFKIY